MFQGSVAVCTNVPSDYTVRYATTSPRRPGEVVWQYVESLLAVDGKSCSEIWQWPQVNCAGVSGGAL